MERKNGGMPIGCIFLLLLIGGTASWVVASIFWPDANESPSLSDRDRVERMTKFILAVHNNDSKAIPKPVKIEPREWEKLIAAREKLSGDFSVTITSRSNQDDTNTSNYLVLFESGFKLECLSFNGQL